MTLPGFDAVARTALLTAALRAVESARPDRLYHDPYAHALAGEAGIALLGEVSGLTRPDREPAGRQLPDTSDYNAIRIRFLDEWLTATVTEGGFDQIVIAAAGMDSRAYRLTWRHPVQIYEIDRPAVLDFKQSVLADQAPAANVVRNLVCADLVADDWRRELVATGFDPDRPAVWLLEGLLYYLPEANVRTLLGEIQQVCASGSALACDVINEVTLTAPSTAKLLRVFAAWGSPWVFGTDEPEELLGCAGFDAIAVQPGESGANYGRWKDAVLAREVPGVPRVFFVHGTRV